MTEADWAYTRQDLDTAQTSADAAVLQVLAQHRSKFVRAIVAGNKNCPFALRQKLALDSSRGVLGWLIGNPAFTKEEFNDIYARSRSTEYCSVVTTALASSALASTVQLTQLARENTWLIQMCILNNYHGRGEDYRELIRSYLSKYDTKYKDWTEIEKLAYYRINHTRIPPEEMSG